MSDFEKWRVEFSAGEKHLEMADKHVAMAAWDYQQARIDELEKEQAAWRKFTDEANRTLDAADKRIASLVVEVELKDKEVRKWRAGWQQADDEAYQYSEELKSLREFCRTEIRKMPPDYVANKTIDYGPNEV